MKNNFNEEENVFFSKVLYIKNNNNKNFKNFKLITFFEIFIEIYIYINKV